MSPEGQTLSNPSTQTQPFTSANRAGVINPAGWKTEFDEIDMDEKRAFEKRTKQYMKEELGVNMDGDLIKEYDEYWEKTIGWETKQELNRGTEVRD